MLKLILVSFLTLSATGAQADGSLVDYDKRLHFGVSAALAWGFYNMCDQAEYDGETCFGVALGSAFAVGLLKEVWDGQTQGNRFDSTDLGADFLGALSMSLFMYTLEW